MIGFTDETLIGPVAGLAIALSVLLYFMKRDSAREKLRQESETKREAQQTALIDGLIASLESLRQVTASASEIEKNNCASHDKAMQVLADVQRSVHDVQKSVERTAEIQMDILKELQRLRSEIHGTTDKRT